MFYTIKEALLLLKEQVKMQKNLRIVRKVVPGGFSKKHNAFCASAYSQHFSNSSVQSIFFNKYCIKITSAEVKSFASLRILKQSRGEFACFKDSISSSLHESEI